jgi:hypothetical protein
VAESFGYTEEPDEPPPPPEPGSPEADSTKPYEIRVWHKGKVAYSLYADQPVEFFDDEAMTDPAELAKLRKPEPGA